MNTRKLWTTAAFAGVALASLTPMAFAQAPAQQSVSESEDIVVTARRREETLQDVPVAVSAISGEALEAVAAADITAIAQAVPNVTLEPSRGTNSTLTAFIRGVGQQDPVAGYEQGVGIYLDDVYLNRPQAAVLDIYDVERVEVLRGPQGTLYGRNTIGGAVKYVTRRLSRDQELRVRGAYGSYNQADLVVSGSLPISEEFRVGGAFARLTRDGFGKNLTTGEENYNKDIWAGRVSAELEPTSNLLFRLSADYTQDDSNARHGHRLLPSALEPSPRLDEYDTRAGALRIGPIGKQDISAWGVQFQADWRINDMVTLKSITAYRTDDTSSAIDFDSTSLRTFDAPVVYTNEQFSQEVQAQLTGDRWSGVVGYYYLDANAFNAFDVLGPAVTQFTLGDVDTSTWAVFGEFTLDITERLSLSLGGRYTEDEREATIVREFFQPGSPSPYFGGTRPSLSAPVFVNGVQVAPRFTGTRKDDAFTPRVILAYEATDDLNLYVSYSEGFKGGLFDPRGNYVNAETRNGVQPEVVESLEFGIKGRFFNDRLQVNTAIFQADYTDVQVPGSIVLPNGSFVGALTNAGGAEFAGVEVEGVARLTDSFTVTGAVGYLDAKYTEWFRNGVNIAPTADIQNTPEWTGNLTGAYTAPLALFGSEGDVSIIGSASYRGDSQQFEFRDPLIDQPAFTLYDLSLIWTSATRGLSVGLHGKNLSDERYKTSGYQFYAVDNSGLAFYGNPLTVTGTIELRF